MSAVKAKATPRPTKARLWAALRKNKHRALKIGMLADLAGVHVDAAKHHIHGLVAAGYVEAVAGEKSGCVQVFTYQLVNDVGVDAPLVGYDGQLLDTGVKNANMWRTMRMLARFDFHELAAHASTTEHEVAVGNAKKYVSMLFQAGYLTIVKPAEKLGRANKPAVYSLTKNTGPKPPMIQKLKTVYDQNLNEVVWQEEAGNE